MRLLYTLLLILARPLVHARLWWRGRRAPSYRERVAERFGAVAADIPPGLVWIHTVSAGETIAAAPLIKRLVSALAETADTTGPQVLVTTMTPTGSAEVQRLFGDTVAHVYAPYDFPDSVERFLGAVQPRLLVLMETEIWPNMISKTADRNVPVVLINARLSERSARGYARVQMLILPVLRRLAWIACQYPADAQRFRELGVSAAQVEVAGSVKFDVATLTVSPLQREQLATIRARAGLAQRRVWIAGSTHAGEEEIVLAAHAQLRARYPDACLVIVPRHPERFDRVAELAAGQFAVARVSGWIADRPPAATPDLPEPAADEQPAVVIADVMGLLRPLYELADVAFVGGSLVELGGHNPIEPAVAGVPLLMGPGRFNFVGVCDAFVMADALQQVQNAEDMADRLGELFADAGLREQRGARARRVVQDNAGATERLLERLTRFAELPNGPAASIDRTP